MLRITAAVLAALVGTATAAAAQESASSPPPPTPPPMTTTAPPASSELSEPHGAGVVEIMAMPVGAMIFTQSPTGTSPRFGNYTLGGSITGNINHVLGLEGEAVWGRGLHENFKFNASDLVGQATPDMFNYSGSLIMSPIGDNHTLVPYVVGGFGGLTMFSTSAVTNLGVTANQTFWLSNAGVGLKWWATRHVGLRGDYRFMHVWNDNTAPVFFGQENRNVHRVYLGVTFTY
jgi:hypothetical protein